MNVPWLSRQPPADAGAAASAAMKKQIALPKERQRSKESTCRFSYSIVLTSLVLFSRGAASGAHPHGRL